MSPTKYRKKPVVIEAMPFGPTPTDAHSLTSWMEANLYVGLVGDALDPDSLRYPDQIEGDDSTPDKGWYIDPADGALMIRTLEGDMRTAPGDYVIRGVKGEFYPCKPEIFAATYEPATPASSDSAPEGAVDETAGGAETTGAVEAAAEAIHGSGGTSMSDEMTRDELLVLMRAWGWRMESEWPGRYEGWEHPGGWTCIVPRDPEKADYDHLMKRAWGTLAAAEAPRTLGIVREAARLHQPRTGGAWEGYCTCSGREWPCPTARALEALTVTEETTT